MEEGLRVYRSKEGLPFCISKVNRPFKIIENEVVVYFLEEEFLHLKEKKYSSEEFKIIWNLKRENHQYSPIPQKEHTRASALADEFVPKIREIIRNRRSLEDVRKERHEEFMDNLKEVFKDGITVKEGTPEWEELQKKIEEENSEYLKEITGAAPGSREDAGPLPNNPLRNNDREGVQLGFQIKIREESDSAEHRPLTIQAPMGESSGGDN